MWELPVGNWAESVSKAQYPFKKRAFSLVEMMTLNFYYHSGSAQHASLVLG